MKKAIINKPYCIKGTMSQSDEFAANVELRMSIANDTRLMDLELVFKQIQLQFQNWTRPVKQEEGERYVIEED
jgi:hypothetical protein